MNALPQLQGAFQDYVLGQGDAAPALLDAVRRQGALGPQARLAIYHNAYRARMREALCEAYERSWTYIGDALFETLAAAYLEAHPSSFSNLRWFGGGFPAFLAQELADYPWVAELAGFEWTLGLAFDAPDAPEARLDALRALAPQAWADLRFALHPSVHLLPMFHNSVALWQALGEERVPPEPAALAEARTWLVWRHALQPHFRSLDTFEANALQALARGATFGEICAGCEAGDVPRVAACLRDWLGTGMLGGADDGKPATLGATATISGRPHEHLAADTPQPR